jgi:hypothetical protein
MNPTHVYIDGFNLYYGALKKTPYKWLNIKRLAETILPQNRITSVKYFTARVQGSESDPDQPQRQEILFRAFRTVPEIEIHSKALSPNQPEWQNVMERARSRFGRRKKKALT